MTQHPARQTRISGCPEDTDTLHGAGSVPWSKHPARPEITFESQISAIHFADAARRRPGRLIRKESRRHGAIPPWKLYQFWTHEGRTHLSSDHFGTFTQLVAAVAKLKESSAGNIRADFRFFPHIVSVAAVGGKAERKPGTAVLHQMRILGRFHGEHYL